MSKLTIERTFQIAVGHHQAGRIPQAEQLYRQILAQQPTHAGALHYLGMIAYQLGRSDIAVDLIRQAIAIEPNNAEAYYNLAIAVGQMGQLNEAIALYRQAIALKPDYPQAFVNLGDALRLTGQLDEAIAANRQAIALKPDYAQTYNNLGNALGQRGQLEEAIAACRQSIALNPNISEAYYNLGIALGYNGQTSEAIAAYRQAIVLNPNSPQPHSNLIFTMHYDPDCDARAIAQEAARWNRQHAEPLKRYIQPHANDRDPDRRLRIGYVSPDLRQHSVAYFLENLLAQHNTASVDVFCYSDVARPDAMTARLQKCAAHWRDIVGLKDAQVDQKIREDRVDILVDLAGHTVGNRLLVFARKPAPVQVTYLGYPDTTGLTTIDYRLTDGYADPPGIADDSRSEQLVRLPDTFLCYRPSDNAPAVGPAPALAAGHVTFGSFNALAKINAPLVAIWSKILDGVPNSRMILKGLGMGTAGARQRILDFFATHQIAPNRVELIGWAASEKEHLQLYNRIDIALDTYPYHGTTTTCEAMWMGVPVVTLAGNAHVSRVGVSLLSNVGVPELIADSQEKYVRLASDLAHDPARLSSLRSTLRQRMAQSPLMDAPRFARNVEAAYRQMWRTWCGA
jgi:predicted O-linked N-acetylglucosamine transferase (SPINDLY family)